MRSIDVLDEEPTVGSPSRAGGTVRKVVAIENVSFDCYADSGHGLGFEWTARAYEDEVDRFGNEHVRADVDTAMYGRATYLGMQSFWEPMLGNPEASATEAMHAAWVNAVPKVVFSTTLSSAGWANTTLVSENLPAAVKELKESTGQTLAIYASPRLVHTFLAEGLLDELRVMIHPVTLGGGTPLIPSSAELDLDLVESRQFSGGAVYVRCRLA
jgi:dihydrofolate reductase